MSPPRHAASRGIGRPGRRRLAGDPGLGSLVAAPLRRRLLSGYSTASLALWVAAVWLVLLLEDLSY
ncbi:MAG: hypothetical protein MUE66_05695 [Acidimicrobiia bacterium]|nr:hypothetical protein [Acidimicrobiia bacterium]